MKAHPFFLRCLAVSLLAAAGLIQAATPRLPIIDLVEWQPLAAQVRRILEASEYLGSPLDNQAEIRKLLNAEPTFNSVVTLQELLDRHCIAGVNINPEMRVKLAPGPARRELVEKGWRQFLVKVHNEAGSTAELVGISPNAIAAHEGGASSTPSSRATGNAMIPLRFHPMPICGWTSRCSTPSR